MPNSETKSTTQEERDALSPEKRKPSKDQVKVFKAGQNAGRDGRSEAAATRTT